MTILEHSLHAPARPHFSFVDCGVEEESFAAAVVAGLNKRNKAIPCRFLYDERGSALFDQICELPEYYLTRTETGILRTHARAIADLIGPRACLIELGSGSSVKTRILLDALHSPSLYAPIDISREHLRGAASALAEDYPTLRVQAICADYAQDLPLPEIGRRPVAFFPGSTIGNLGPREALGLLRAWRKRLGKNGLMIIGADLKKDPRVLEAAYDDGAGVTEAFIRNILVRIRRELGADIDPEAFDYQARYVESAGRVEMHLRAQRAQTLSIAGESIAIAAGERIHVENSHKYAVQEIIALGRAAGFAPAACFSDADHLFSVHVWAGR